MQVASGPPNEQATPCRCELANADLFRNRADGPKSKSARDTNASALGRGEGRTTAFEPATAWTRIKLDGGRFVTNCVVLGCSELAAVVSGSGPLPQRFALA